MKFLKRRHIKKKTEQKKNHPVNGWVTEFQLTIIFGRNLQVAHKMTMEAGNIVGVCKFSVEGIFTHDPEGQVILYGK